MDLEQARKLFKDKTERTRQRPATPEEAAREARFDRLHDRFLAIGPKKNGKPDRAHS